MNISRLRFVVLSITLALALVGGLLIVTRLSASTMLQQSPVGQGKSVSTLLGESSANTSFVWISQTVGAAIKSRKIAIAIDSSERPHLAYYLDNDDHSVVYAQWNGYSWITQTISKKGSINYISLVLDSNNYPHLSYHNWPDFKLEYAHWNGTDWLTDTVAVSSRAGFHSMVIDG